MIQHYHPSHGRHSKYDICLNNVSFSFWDQDLMEHMFHLVVMFFHSLPSNNNNSLAFPYHVLNSFKENEC